MKKTILNKLKYFSINALIGGPNLEIKNPTRKKRAERLIAEAIIKVLSEIETEIQGSPMGKNQKIGLKNIPRQICRTTIWK